jgi:ribosomal protein S18 acetylase RimI-like enzyme
VNKPKVICLCGSTRFVNTFNEYNKKLTLEGNIVLSIEIVAPQSRENDPQYVNSEGKKMLNELHFRKIDLSDEIFVLNVGGYIGRSTADEIAYAHQTGKFVRYLEPVKNNNKEIVSTPVNEMITEKAISRNQKEIIIREFTMDDYEKVVAIWEEAGIHYRPNGRESRIRIAKELKAGRAIFLVAATDKKVVGVVLGTHDGRKGWINRLAVAEDFRRQNVASKLVAAVETRLNALNIDITACLIEPENAVSKSFFTKVGYTKTPVEYFSRKQSPDA